jgi:hypothetical protein
MDGYKCDLMIMHYLQRLFSIKLHERVMTTGEHKRTGEKAVLACFRVLTRYLTGGKP